MKRFLPLVAVLALASPAQAYTPGSFQTELNNTDWGTSGENVSFTNISQCNDITMTESLGVRNPARLQSLQQELEVHKDNIKKYNDMDDERMYNHIPLARAVNAKIRVEKENVIETESIVGYGCRSGFIKISNPQGVRVCEVSGVAIREGNLNYGAQNCVWR